MKDAIKLENISNLIASPQIFPTRIEIIHGNHSLHKVLTQVTLFSFNLVMTVSVIVRRMRNFYSGRESEQPNSCVSIRPH